MPRVPVLFTLEPFHSSPPLKPSRQGPGREKGEGATGKGLPQRENDDSPTSPANFLIFLHMHRIGHAQSETISSDKQYGPTLLTYYLPTYLPALILYTEALKPQLSGVAFIAHNRNYHLPTK